jgi:hypothetical protein
VRGELTIRSANRRAKRVTTKRLDRTIVGLAAEAAGLVLRTIEEFAQ